MFPTAEIQTTGTRLREIRLRSRQQFRDAIFQDRDQVGESGVTPASGKTG